jgi:hypothetical protein
MRFVRFAKSVVALGGEWPLPILATVGKGSDPEVALGAKRSLGQDFRATTAYRSITVVPSAIPQRLL